MDGERKRKSSADEGEDNATLDVSRERFETSVQLGSRISNQNKRLQMFQTDISELTKFVGDLKNEVKEENDRLKRLQYEFETAVAREKALHSAELLFGSNAKGYAKSKKFVYALKRVIDNETSVEDFFQSVKHLLLPQDSSTGMSDSDESDLESPKTKGMIDGPNETASKVIEIEEGEASQGGITKNTSVSQEESHY